LAHESFSVSEVIPAPPDQIYSAWLDTATHSAFTGEEAMVEPFVGGRHTAFGGYSEGTTLELHPGRRIVQTWRSKDFPEGSPDSRLEVTLEETLGGTMVTILHSEIPTGQGEQYREGWVKYYLQALKDFFAGGPADADAEESDEAEVEVDGALAIEMPSVATVPVVRKPASAKNGTHKTQRAAATKVPKTKVAAKAKAKPKAKARKAAPKKVAAKARKAPPKKKAAAKARKAAPKKKAPKAKAPKAKAKKKSKR
jgi:uncharacterized protein YndB with AHSA1/START domain